MPPSPEVPEKVVLDPSQDEIMDVAGPAIVRAFERHMGLRNDSDWTPYAFLLADSHRVKDVNELYIPKDGFQPVILVDETIDPSNLSLPTEQWREEGSRLSVEARSGLIINGLTEDNLPHYTSMLSLVLGQYDGARQWVNRWTAEESRHVDAFKILAEQMHWGNMDYLEKARLAQIEKGEIPRPPNVEELFIYTSIQEVATRVSHSREATHLPRGTLRKLIGKVASEEDDHFRVYFDAAEAVRQAFPDRFLIAFGNQLTIFEMPGTGIENFKKHAKVISAAGIYDVVDMYNISNQLYRKWDVGSIVPQSEESYEAKLKIDKRLEFLRRQSERLEESRQQRRESGDPYQVEHPFPTYEGNVLFIPPPTRAKKIGEFALRVNDWKELE
jgi:acyl-[acyl-carrier-protein] desaturase